MIEKQERCPNCGAGNIISGWNYDGQECNCGFPKQPLDPVVTMLEAIATNFDMRAKNIAMHNQRSHTSNTQQRKNMEIMHQVWSDAAKYVRGRMK